VLNTAGFYIFIAGLAWLYVLGVVSSRRGVMKL
jgi:hypothetical protein